MARVRVASVEEVPIETVKPVMANHDEICLAHAEDGNFYAIDDICTHENFLLSGGELFELQVECPQHGSRFNLKTGAVTGLPAVIPTKVYPVEVEGEPLTIIDAGTGIAALARSLGRIPDFTCNLFIGHLHWDHLIGLPFFFTADAADSHIHIYGRPMPLEEIVAQIDAVTVESARAAGRALLGRGRPAVAALGPAGLESAAAIAETLVRKAA